MKKKKSKQQFLQKVVELLKQEIEVLQSKKPSLSFNVDEKEDIHLECKRLRNNSQMESLPLQDSKIWTVISKSKKKTVQYEAKLLKDWKEHLEIAHPIKDKLLLQLFPAESTMDLSVKASSSSGFSALKPNPAGENNFVDNLEDYSLFYLCFNIFKEHKYFCPTILKTATALLKDNSNWKNQNVGNDGHVERSWKGSLQKGSQSCLEIFEKVT